jgi:hypothetical protein
LPGFYWARKYLASFFFSFSAADYMDWTDFTERIAAGVWQSGRTLIGFAVASHDVLQLPERFR